MLSLWALNPGHVINLSREEFALGIRLRIGVPLFDDNILGCSFCGDDVLDASGSHCLRCTLIAGNRGHNAVRDEILSLAHLVTPLLVLRRLI